MNINDLKPRDIISYGTKYRLNFSVEKPNNLNEYSYGKFYPKQSSLFLILEIKKIYHTYIKDLYGIKFFVENKICYLALAQEDIEKFNFYYVKQ